MGPEFGVLVCQLECEGREYEVEIAAIFEITRTKEGRSETLFCEHMLCDGLSDCGFPGPSEPVQPEDGRLAGVLGPRLDIAQHCISCPFEATSAVTVTIFGSLCASTSV